MVFLAFLILSSNFEIKSSWSEPQSSPGLVYVVHIQLLHLFKEYNQSDFSIDHLVISMCSHLLDCWKMFAMTTVFSLQSSVSLCPASLCNPRPYLPVTPGIPWLPTFSFFLSFFFFFYFLLFHSSSSAPGCPTAGQKPGCNPLLGILQHWLKPPPDSLLSHSNRAFALILGHMLINT